MIFTSRITSDEHFRSWYEGKRDCSLKGGVLFSVQNKGQQDFIKDMLFNIRDYSPVWLGLHDTVHEETWQWLSGVFFNAISIVFI